MKQILIDRYGPPEEVARCAQVPDVGAPAAGEVVFDVLAFPINPADVSFCRGTYRLQPPLPAIPGAECVGRVTAVGAGVSDVRPGDLVINSHGGPDMAPIPPTFGAPRRSRGAPRSPNVRSAPAQPWRSSIPQRSERPGAAMALLDFRRSPDPRRGERGGVSRRDTAWPTSRCGSTAKAGRSRSSRTRPSFIYCATTSS